MTRRERRKQADFIAKDILKHPPKQDAQVPASVFKALRKRMNKPGL